MRVANRMNVGGSTMPRLQGDSSESSLRVSASGHGRRSGSFALAGALGFQVQAVVNREKREFEAV